VRLKRRFRVVAHRLPGENSSQNSILIFVKATFADMPYLSMNVYGRQTMTAVRLDGLTHSVQITHEWIKELNSALGWRDHARAYRLLRSVLHAIRDWLEVNEAAEFAAQLPTFIRGVYYEAWRPAITPVKPRSLVDFEARIEKDLAPDIIDNTRAVIHVAFAFLSQKISAGEISDVRQTMPADIRALWTHE